MGADILFGFLIGTPAMMPSSSACAWWPAPAWKPVGGVDPARFLSGIFFGGVLPLSRQMARHEKLERAERAVVVPLPVPADVVEAAPAA